MKVGDYVLYNNYAWEVITKHKKGTFQIVRLHGNPASAWGNMEVSEGVCEVITKEVADVFIASQFPQEERWDTNWSDYRGIFYQTKRRSK